MVMTETFHSIASIAVAFAGFTGIVVALRKPTDARATAFDRSRMLDLLLASLGATFFAFLPETVFAFEVDESSGWRGIALSFALFHLVEVVVAANIAGGTLIFTRLDWILVPIGAVVMIAQWATGLGALSAYVQAVYLVALLWFLFVAAYQFAQLLMTYNRPE
jgi:hypothetical protein